MTGTVPREHGIGIEQRAAHTLKALAKLGRVHVVYFGPPASAAIVPESARAMCASWHVISGRTPFDLARWLRRVYVRLPGLPAPPAPARAWLARHVQLEGSAAQRRLPEILPAAPSYVHVFRLGLAPLAASFMRASTTQVCIDVDDLESSTLDLLAARAEQARESGLAWTFATMAGAARRFEQTWLPQASSIAVCSERDRLTMKARFAAAQVTVLPNVFAVPERPLERSRDPQRLQLLFVGALGYYPNIDALRFLVRDVLPLLRRDAGRPITLHVAGRGGTRTLRQELRRVREVVLHGAVDDLTPLYARVDVAVCPIRAGGGTRIKILEAFAYGVPVVATSMGAAGLSVTQGRELLLAENAEDFARAIGRAASDSYGTLLSDGARAFVLGHHSEARFHEVVRALAKR
jgi:glycosyltransferase involved in cell wall biosynthesis